jgi:plastocyanin
MNALRLWPLLAALLLPCLPASAANHDVTITGNSFSPSELTVEVGDTVTFRNQSGGVHNAVSDPGAANTFRCANGCDATGGNGAPSAANWTAVVTIANPGVTPYHCAIHGGTGGEGMSGTITATGTAAAPPVAVDDLVRLLVNDAAVDIDVLANDFKDTAALAGGSLTILQAPSAGTATVVDGGNGATVSDDKVRYSLPADADVDTTLTYRVCDGAAACSDGAVRVLARAFDDDDLTVDAAADAGFVDVPIGDLPALPGPTYEVTALATSATNLTDRSAVVDTSPENPWNGTAGSWSANFAIPAPVDGLPLDFGVVADAELLTGTNIDLYMGPDLDGDNTPDENEVRCTSAMSNAVERCEMHLTHPGTGQVRYWVMVHNVGASATTFGLYTANVALRAGDPRLVMTGPGHMPAATDAVVRLGWNDPAMMSPVIVPRFAFARLRQDASNDLGWVPVRLNRVAGDPVARSLVSGQGLTLAMQMGVEHERVYVDVPPGTTKLTLTSSASHGGHELYVSRRGALTHPAIQPARPRDEAVASDTSPASTKTIELVPPQLVPGRWYVTPKYLEMVEGDVTLTATLEGDAPTIRSGSYFNPDRSGHGMFVYPAGGGTVWTVLWYHYFEDGSPTWYYLEGAAPDANGVFRSGVYRGTWDGDSNFLTQVGEATLTPSGPDAFTWSYTVDGQSGSEPLVALGRGCPTVDGDVRDSSSTWYDDATAGTGYSVQLFPNGYEYTAAFVYDGIGRPRYLAAEMPPPPGGLVQTYTLEQLTGFCPLCARTAAPSREDVGTFTRTYTGGTLTRIEVDAIYADGVPGAWTGDDDILPLGGSDTVQGCDL